MNTLVYSMGTEVDDILYSFGLTDAQKKDSMGTEVDDILYSFGLTDAQKKEYATVVSSFEGYFVKKQNVIYEGAKFNRRKQHEVESVDTFITALHNLAEHCRYGKLREEMIQDRIVVGLLDTALSEKLQMDPDLSLEKAMTSARQREMVRKQQPVLRHHEQPIEIDMAESDKKNRHRHRKPQPNYHNRQQTTVQQVP